MVNWGEVYYVALREYDEEYANKVLHAMKNMPIEIVEVNRELTMLAARFKAKGGMSYADCFASGLAKLKKAAELVTGDKEFREVENEIKIRWI
jgi:predicted nucleic acid-binding protein